MTKYKYTNLKCNNLIRLRKPVDFKPEISPISSKTLKVAGFKNKISKEVNRNFMNQILQISGYLVEFFRISHSFVHSYRNIGCKYFFYTNENKNSILMST